MKRRGPDPEIDLSAAKVLSTVLPQGVGGPLPGGSSASKYRNVRAEYRGVLYDSKAEAARAAALDLILDVARGEWWLRQPTFRLGCPENVYRADFLVVTPGRVWVEDVKGLRTAKFRRDVKLWRSYGPCPLEILTGKSVEVIIPRSVRT